MENNNRYSRIQLFMFLLLCIKPFSALVSRVSFNVEPETTANRIRRPIQRLWCIAVFALFPLGTAVSATFTQDFQIDPETSFFSCSGDCIASPSYPVAGTFRMVVDDNLGYANMRLAAIDVTTPELPYEPFQIPGYFARYVGPAFYGDENDCHWPFSSGVCFSAGNFSTYSGSFNGTSLTMTGSQGLSLSSSYIYTINAAVVPVPAAFWLFGSGLLGLFGVARRRKAA